MPLSKTERLILANQYRILALLEPDQKEDHDAECEAVRQRILKIHALLG